MTIFKVHPRDLFGCLLGNDRTPEIEVRPDGRTSLLRSGRTPDRTGPDRPAGHNAGP